MSNDALLASSQVLPSTVGEQVPPLIHDRRFRRFCVAKLLQLSAQNALIYGLFISLIADQDTYLAGSAFVLASVLPSVFLSVPGGIVADRLPNKAVLLVVMAIRVAIMLQFLRSGLSLGEVIGLTFLVWAVYQFFTPAENEAVVAVARPEKTAAALAMLQALSLVAQILGAGLIAPLSLDLLGTDGLFVLVALMLVTSGIFYFVIPGLTPPREEQLDRLGWWKALPQGYRVLRADAVLLEVTGLRVIVDATMLMVLVAAPKFITDTLGASAGAAVYIGSPAALGLALGLFLTPVALRLLSVRVLTLIGYLLLTGVVACLPFVGEISPWLLGQLSWWDSVRSEAGLSQDLATTIVLLPLAGFGLSVVQVASRAAVYQRVNTGSIGQVLATQSAIGSLAAVLPTFLAGALLDVLPVNVFFMVLVLVSLSLAITFLLLARRRSTAAGPVATI